MSIENSQVGTRKFTFPEPMWAGTEHSLTIAAEAHDRVMAGLFDGRESPKAEDAPYHFSLQGSIGVVSVKGPLVNTDNPYNKYIGVTSYADIRRAMVYAAQNSSVKAILMDVDSGGGAVSGCADCGALIASIDKGVKPVYAFTDGQMASAAYWLGSSARGVYVSASAISGSIGVIASHLEYSKAFKDAGIGVTVMRAGKYKALVNRLEPMSETAKGQLQDQLNSAYEVFIGHVAKARGTSVEIADQKMGQGREFFGESAVTAGLADGVKTFDSMMTLINKKVVDKTGNREHTAGNSLLGQSMPREALTEQAIAALAAGAAALAAGAAAPAAEAPLAAAAEAPLAAAAEAPLAAAAEAPLAAAAEAPLAAAAEAPVMAYLQSQVKDKDATILAQSIEINGLKAKVDGMEASHTGLMKIAVQSVSNMKVGLGLAKVDLSTMSAEALLAEHAATSEAFTAAFKVGGVAAVKPPPEVKAEEAVPDHLHMARVAATRFHTNTK